MVIKVVELAEELVTALEVTLEDLEGSLRLGILVFVNSKLLLQLVGAELRAWV